MLAQYRRHQVVQRLIDQPIDVDFLGNLRFGVDMGKRAIVG